MDIPTELKIKWGKISRVTTSEIEHEDARLLLNGLGVNEKQIDTHVYLCSDYRNEVLRDIFNLIGSVAVYNTAGNVIYNPHNVASIVIAHGADGPSACGAVGYVKDLKGGQEVEYKAFAELIDGDSIINARRQLDKVPEIEQAGILYFDHAKGRITDPSDKKYSREGNRFKIFEEVKRSLENWYSTGNILAFAEGQDPEVILLNNIHGPPAGHKAFQIDFQNNRWDTIIRDSLHYAMTHALQGSGSFQHTKSTILAFQENRGLPQGLEDFLNGPDQGIMTDYIGRGGNIFLAVVGTQSSLKRVYTVSTK